MNILIDNGHGNNTAGKCSPDRSLLEYAYTREIAARLDKALKSRGYDAQRIVAEDYDVSLTERCNRVNTICKRLGTNNVILISVHCNGAGDKGKWLNARGWCAWTSRGQTKADILASELYKSAETALAEYKATFTHEEIASKQQPIRTDYSDGDPDFEAGFYICKHTACPCVLTENLFQDNKKDVAFLLSDAGKEAIVKLHVDGIINYINQHA